MTDGYRTGSPARATASNGTPQGPRVRRPGYAGWWLYAPDGSLVPDGHVEPVDPNERRERQERAAEPGPCINDHPGAYRKVGPSGKSYCARCVTERSRERRGTAA